LPILSIGGAGVISVAANIVPEDILKIIANFHAGNIAAAQKSHYKILPLLQALFIETNPIPVKAAMALMGLCSAEIRLPLCEMSPTHQGQLELALKNYGLLKG
jgi:4-hydroxy-tetrahydrodipicolinate synthase